jgi:hypothetical protein
MDISTVLVVGCALMMVACGTMMAGALWAAIRRRRDPEDG